MNYKQQEAILMAFPKLILDLNHQLTTSNLLPVTETLSQEGILRHQLDRESGQGMGELPTIGHAKCEWDVHGTLQIVFHHSECDGRGYEGSFR